MLNKKLIVAAIVLLLFLVGCSGNNTPTSPVVFEEIAAAGDSHQMWGLWQFTFDPATEALDIVQLRGADLHLNVLVFLEPPVLVFLTLESAPEISGSILDIDIGLRHPFLGLTEFTGFDVCGILISHGSLTGFESDPSIRMPGEGDTRLLNADGFTRWWNPTEFPYNESAPIAGYVDGELGIEDSSADYDATLNGYKYFVDDLDPNDPLTMADLDRRGMFSAGQKNIRHYTLDMGTGFTFNYAVDANWEFPSGSPPFDAPEDFGEAANRPEAWNVTTFEVENTLAYEDDVPSGTLTLNIAVYDWFNVELNEVTVESPGNIAPVVTSTPVGGGDGYATYQVVISSDDLTESGWIDLLITVKSEVSGYQELLPGKSVCAYFVHPAEIADETIVDIYDWVLDDEQIITNTDDHDRDPAINQVSTYGIDIGYLRLIEVPPSTSASCQMLKSIDSGGGFTYQWLANSIHGLTYLDDLRVCTDPFGDSVFHYQTFLVPSMALWEHASVVRNPIPLGENQGLNLNKSEKSNEVIWTADQRLLSIADENSIIDYKKGTDPGSLFYNSTWGGWLGAPQIVIKDYPAVLSETRSILKDSYGGIHLAYYGGDSGVWIKMISNTDGNGTNWNSDVYITQGLSDEFASRIEPSIALGPDGEFHASFIGVLSPQHSILYSTSTNGSSWAGYMPIFTNMTGPISEVTIDTFEHVDSTIIAISFEVDGDIWMAYSLNGGQSFPDPILISDGTGNSLEADIRADTEGYVHIAWAQFAGVQGMYDDYDIRYRRAHLAAE